ncbi:hypothetical protein [Aeromonas phage 65.2]|uniref:Uncharacterized protein n=1 Tax=Aeromonas phage 65.2 TaxID=1932896 RepID=A0A219YCB9_9CAUD|nr:hypothetical protein [Aeromonas phage 65.2]
MFAMFKKTTKTDKSVAISSRIEWITTHVNTKEKLVVFMDAIMNRDSKHLVMGRSPISLITPVFGTENRKDLYCIRNRFNETKITVESYGVRMWFKNNYTTRYILKVLTKLFKVSSVRLTNDPNYPYNVVIKIGKPSGEVVFDTSLDDKIEVIMKDIELCKSRVRLHDERIKNFQSEVQVINEKMRTESNSKYHWSDKIRDLEKQIRELKG